MNWIRHIIFSLELPWSHPKIKFSHTYRYFLSSVLTKYWAIESKNGLKILIHLVISSNLYLLFLEKQICNLSFNYNSIYKKYYNQYSSKINHILLYRSNYAGKGRLVWYGSIRTHKIYEHPVLTSFQVEVLSTEKSFDKISPKLN